MTMQGSVIVNVCVYVCGVRVHMYVNMGCVMVCVHFRA